jgi:hypothetical protein
MEERTMSHEPTVERAANDEPLMITMALDEWLRITSRLTAAETALEAARPLLTDPWITRNYRPGLSNVIAKALGFYDALAARKPEAGT